MLQSKTGANATKYVYALSTRPLAQYSSDVSEYLLADALGSVRQIADADGNVTLAESYEPYGSVLSSTGTASSIFGYAGEQVDTSGLVYLRARYMQPTLGIFLARDPWSGEQMRPGSMNGFGYVEGNPVNRVDPTGRISEAEKGYILYLYLFHIKHTTERLNDRALTNLSDNAFAAMIAAKVLVEDATPVADDWVQGTLKYAASSGAAGLPDWQRDLVEQYLAGGEISFGPANIPLATAERGLRWWEQNHLNLPSRCQRFENIQTGYYDARDSWLYRLIFGSPREILAQELDSDSGAVQGMALALLESSSRARNYWTKIGQPSRQLSAYTIALGVLNPDSQLDSALYTPSRWTSKGFAWNWVEAADDTADLLKIAEPGFQLSMPADFLPYTDEEKNILAGLREG